MKTITIGALKGGVGKTNFAFNFSCFLAIEKKKRILILDLDPQANLTQCFQLEVTTSHAMDMFLKHEKNIEEIIFKTNFETINIVPTNISMSNLEIQLFNELSRENKLKKFLNKNKIFLKDNYDYIIIDTNPSLNITNINAYLAADNIVLVSDNSIHSLRAIDVIGNMWETITKNLEIPNNIKAIVLNNFDHFNISKDFKDELEKLPLKELLIKQDIRKKQVFKTSEITGVPVIKLLAKQDNPYFHIVTELEQKGVV